MSREKGTHLRRCICGKEFYAKETTNYCKECIALAKRKKRPVIMLKGGKHE